MKVFKGNYFLRLIDHCTTLKHLMYFDLCVLWPQTHDISNDYNNYKRPSKRL